MDAPDEASKAVACDVAERRPDWCEKTVASFEKHLGVAGNMWRAIDFVRDFVSDDDIVAVYDADDMLLKGAIHEVVHAYAKYGCLATYGSYIKASVGRKTRISQPYDSSANVRKDRWRGSHLKTFRGKLLKHLSEDLFQHEGRYLDAASDLALMIPVLELAGLDRVHHISEPIYHWRDNSDGHHSKRKVQLLCEAAVRAKKPLRRLP